MYRFYLPVYKCIGKELLQRIIAHRQQIRKRSQQQGQSQPISKPASFATVSHYKHHNIHKPIQNYSKYCKQ